MDYKAYTIWPPLTFWLCLPFAHSTPPTMASLLLSEHTFYLRAFALGLLSGRFFSQLSTWLTLSPLGFLLKCHLKMRPVLTILLKITSFNLSSLNFLHHTNYYVTGLLSLCFLSLSTWVPWEQRYLFCSLLYPQGQEQCWYVKGAQRVMNKINCLNEWTK